MKWMLTFLLNIILVLSAIGQDLGVTSSDWVIKNLSNPEEKELDIQQEGLYELSMEFTLPDTLPDYHSYGIFMSLLASSELYWDGEQIGQNGIIGNNESEEIPGKVYYFAPLSRDQLTEGVHHLKIKYSNFHSNGKMRIYVIKFTQHERIYKHDSFIIAMVHIYAGFFLIVGIFYVIRYIRFSRHTYTILFALLCLSFFVLLIIEFVRGYYYYPYHWHFPRLQIILGVTIFIATCLPIFFVVRLGYGKYAKWLLLLLPVYGIVASFHRSGFDLVTNLTMLIGFVSSLIVCLYGVWRKKEGSRLLLLSILPITLFIFIFPFHYDSILYPGFGFLILLNLILLVNEERRKEVEKQEAIRRSDRLKLDLLKKNIQPHFIQNTLTSAIEWIEQNPKKGVDLLFEISREFDLILDVSEETLIPVSTEVELCKTHLNVMGYRKDKHLELVLKNVDMDFMIPPAVFLTMVENGITHDKSNSEKLIFVLEMEDLTNGKTFTLSCPASPSSETIEEGNGIRYIKARLQESYPDKWIYKYGNDSGKWVDRLEITNS